MVKQTSQNPNSTRYAKSNARRKLKNLANVQNFLRRSTQKRNRKSESVCNLCGEKGALLACIKCLNLYHLICLDHDTLDLPLAEWACNTCSSSYQNSLLSSLETSLAKQAQDKRNIIKKLKKTVKTFNNREIKEFKTKFPSLVKNGEINYPIDDQLLWKKPWIHELRLIKAPQVHTLFCDEQTSDNLISFCDFIHTFQNFLNAPSFTCENLYTLLSYLYETQEFKALIISILRPLVLALIDSESYKKQGPMINYLVNKSRKIVNIDRLLDYSYLTFLESIFVLWADDISTINSEVYEDFTGFSFSHSFFEIAAERKLKVLSILVGLLLGSDVLSKECEIRAEEHWKLSREYAELKSSIKNKKHAECRKEEVEAKMEGIKKQMKMLRTRTECLGTDKHHNEYYIFDWDPSKLFIFQNRQWSYYDNPDDLQLFISSLNSKGIQESLLINSLSAFLSNFSQNLTLSTNICKDHTQFSIGTLKTWLKDLHNSISKTLKISQSLSYISSIDSSDLPSLLSLMILFHQAFTRRFSNEEPYKTSKILKLWDYSELSSIWETAVKECKNISEAFICMHLLASIVDKFNNSNKCSVEIEENAYSVARRSYNLERNVRVKKEAGAGEHEEACYLCGEFGLVVCCDKCTKVAHLGCVKAWKVPDGDWICPDCTGKKKCGKLIRSSQIKY